MSVWYSVLLGLLQGATEFLPVSSSAHLCLLQLLWNASWTTIANHAYRRLYAPMSTVVVYRDESDLHRLEEMDELKELRYKNLAGPSMAEIELIYESMEVICGWHSMKTKTM